MADRVSGADAKKDILALWRDVEMFNVTNAPRPCNEPEKKVAVFNYGDPLPWTPGHAGYLAPTDRAVWFHRVHIGIADKREAVRRIVEKICGEGSMQEDELDRLYGRCWGSTVLLDWLGRPLRETYDLASFAVAGIMLRAGKGLAEATTQIEAQKMGFLSRNPADENASLDPQPPQEKVEKPLLLEGVDWARDVEIGVGKAAPGLKVKEAPPPPAADEDEIQITIGSEPMAWSGFDRDLQIRLVLFEESCENQPDIIVESIRMPRAKFDAKKRVRQEMPDTGFMNSFFLRDLSSLAKADAEISEGPLAVYLGEASAPATRIDVLDDLEAMVEATRPARLGLGRWPAPVKHPLMLAQQAAVGEALYGASPLIAINGPPGTGKTTLLRDVIADIVVRRALAIAALGSPAQAFTRQSILFGEHRVTLWNPEIVDGFGIVVASSNNAAVENVSLELPAVSSISGEDFPAAGYLSPVAPLVAELAGVKGPAWGLLAARLGNKANCSRFFRSAMPFRGEGSPKEPGRAALGDHLFDSRQRANEKWTVIRDTVLSLHGAVQAAIAEMAGDYLALRRDPAARLAPRRGIRRPDRDFRALDPSERQLTSLWVDPAFDKLRSELFLLSLRLIEATLAANAGTVMANFRAAHAVLAKSGTPPAGPAVRAQVWNTIFAVTPVVSTTLASVEKLFSGLGPGSLGWLLVDEAGQAVPQSLAGALSRARRAVVIGDPLQVEPVQTIPAPMIEKLREQAGIDPEFSPATASAQTVADRTMRVGGFIARPEGEPIWTGMPLRAHRRCGEPMFSISNRISYAGQMVQAGRRSFAIRSILGHSSWTDITGTASAGHVVHEEMAELERVLRLVKKDWPVTENGEATIYIITPFRHVMDAANGLLRKLKLNDRIECGTIHRFQGREADIVLLVLGSTAGPAGYSARSWASSRSNILNVALTRARSRIHVIGSYADWSRHAFFGDLARVMMAANRLLERETEAA